MLTACLFVTIAAACICLAMTIARRNAAVALHRHADDVESAIAVALESMAEPRHSPSRHPSAPSLLLSASGVPCGYSLD